jgi:hypothetical protein
MSVQSNENIVASAGAVATAQSLTSPRSIVSALSTILSSSFGVDW